MTTVNRLGADDWAKAALGVIATVGVEHVTVEGLGRRLGVTKGSFYWHFADRQALITSALDLWERRATVDIIEQLGVIVDPVVRLRALFTTSLGDVIDGSLDAALVVAVNDRVVGAAVRRVTRRRVEFLERLFADMGFTPAKARTRARIAYSTYIGHFHLSRALDDDGDLDGPLDAYIDQLVASLAADRPASAAGSSVPA